MTTIVLYHLNGGARSSQHFPTMCWERLVVVVRKIGAEGVSGSGLVVDYPERALRAGQPGLLEGPAWHCGDWRLGPPCSRNRFRPAQGDLSKGERIAPEADDVAELVLHEEGNHVCNNIPTSIAVS